MRLFRFSACSIILLLISPCTSWAVAPQPQEPRDSVETAQVGLLPLPILYYTPETGIAGGAAILFFHRADRTDKLARPSSASLNLIYTQKKQIIAELNPDMYLQRALYRITGSVNFIKYPQKFYGIGNNTPESYEESYTSRAFSISVDALRRVSPGVNAGLSFFYETRSLSEFKANGLLEPGTIVGSRGGTTIGPGIVLHWDTRNSIFAPTEGRYYQLSL